MSDGTDHIHEVFAADFRYLARFIVDHPGEDDVIEELIQQMAAYRADSYTILMLKCFEGGEATAEAHIAQEQGEIQ